MVAFGSRSRQHGTRGTDRMLAEDGFATASVLAPLPLPEQGLVELPPDPGDDDPPPVGSWLDDPTYEVGAFLLGLRDR